MVYPSHRSHPQSILLSLKYMLVSLGLLISIATLAQQPTPVSKIDGEILDHRRQKQIAAKMASKQGHSYLVKYELNPNLPAGEECALYVAKRLSKQEMATLAKRGIKINPDVFIPPVKGRHAHGFHLAQVDYDALPTIEKDHRFLRLDSLEFASYPQNDRARFTTGVDRLQMGLGLGPYTGEGIKFAVADSGLDVTHPDVPALVEAFDVTDGDTVSQWGTDVSNQVTDHGTHVAVSAVGTGQLSEGRFAGSAPGAQFYFYKIANDTSGTSSFTDQIEALNRAQAVGCRVFSMSFGGYSTFMDGSNAMEQAIDAATAAGMMVFTSAGNTADDDEHTSFAVQPNSTSQSFRLTINHSNGSDIYNDEEFLRVIWRDGPGQEQLTMQCTNLGTSEQFSQAFSGRSERNTRGKRYRLVPNLAAGTSKTYEFTLTHGGGPAIPRVHIYRTRGKGTFDNPDTAYTVSSPALADTAIAVGAWTHRKRWQTYKGTNLQFTSFTEDTRTPFSSMGPRIDGRQKPEILAPGGAMISARDSEPGLAERDEFIVDNDGIDLDGSGPANYYIKTGTSMACPHAAGSAVLLLQSNPALTPAEVLQAMTQTAANSATPNNQDGFGLIDTFAAAGQVANDCIPATQMRWLSHITRPTGGFVTTLTFTSLSDQSESITLTAYAEDGSLQQSTVITLPAGEFSVIPANDLLAGVVYSHLGIEGSQRIAVTAGYRIAPPANGGTAHVQDHALNGTRFLLYQGQWDTVFDGMALVNVSNCAAKIEGIRYDRQGRETFRTVLHQGLEPKAKMLLVFSTVFPDSPDEQIAIVASEPVNAVFLRGSPSTDPFYLYQTEAIPFDP